jgi:hypothetical protein
MPRDGARGPEIPVAWPGPNRLELAAPDGRIVFAGSAPGPHAYAPAAVRPGVYLARLSAGGGMAARRVAITQAVGGR